MYWLGRTDGLTCHSNLPLAGTVIDCAIVFGKARTSARLARGPDRAGAVQRRALGERERGAGGRRAGQHGVLVGFRGGGERVVVEPAHRLVRVAGARAQVVVDHVLVRRVERLRAGEARGRLGREAERAVRVVGLLLGGGGRLVVDVGPRAGGPARQVLGQALQERLVGDLVGDDVRLVGGARRAQQALVGRVVVDRDRDVALVEQVDHARDLGLGAGCLAARVGGGGAGGRARAAPERQVVAVEVDAAVDVRREGAVGERRDDAGRDPAVLALLLVLHRAAEVVAVRVDDRDGDQLALLEQRVRVVAGLVVEQQVPDELERELDRRPLAGVMRAAEQGTSAWRRRSRCCG